MCREPTRVNFQKSPWHKPYPFPLLPPPRSHRYLAQRAVGTNGGAYARDRTRSISPTRTGRRPDGSDHHGGGGRLQSSAERRLDGSSLSPPRPWRLAATYQLSVQLAGSSRKAGLNSSTLISHRGLRRPPPPTQNTSGPCYFNTLP